MYHMMISNNVWTNPWPGPWQWTADTTRKDNRSSLLDPAHENYMRLKRMIEEAVNENILSFWYKYYMTLQRTALGQSQGSVKTFLGSSYGWWADTV